MPSERGHGTRQCDVADESACLLGGVFTSCGALTFTGGYLDPARNLAMLAKRTGFHGFTVRKVPQQADSGNPPEFWLDCSRKATGWPVRMAGRLRPEGPANRL